MAKRKCIFRENLTEQFPFIKHSNKGVNFAYCSICNTDINIGNGGISLIKQHLISTKHVSYEHEICTTLSLAVFIRDQNSPISLKIAGCICISYSKAPPFLQDNGLYISLTLSMFY